MTTNIQKYEGITDLEVFKGLPKLSRETTIDIFDKYNLKGNEIKLVIQRLIYLEECQTLKQLADKIGYEEHYLCRFYNQPDIKKVYRELLTSAFTDAEEQYIPLIKLNTLKTALECAKGNKKITNQELKLITHFNPQVQVKETKSLNINLRKEIDPFKE
jgi:hypothetical protein